MAVLSAEAVAPKIREYNGNLAAVARHFGVSRVAVHSFVKARPTLLEVCQECRETMKDNAESSLYRAVIAGEGWALQFYLKCQAKDRGYVEQAKLQLGNDPESPLVLTLEQVVREVINHDRVPGPNGTAARD